MLSPVVLRFESSPVVLRFESSPDVSLRISAPAAISEPQKWPTGGVSIESLVMPVMLRCPAPQTCPSGSLLRLYSEPPERDDRRSLNHCSGSWLRLYVRAPERANRRRDNHGPTTSVTDFSALQMSPSRISAPAFSEPQRGPTVGGTIIPHRRYAQFLVLPRRSRVSASAVFPSPREGQQ